MKKCMIIVMVLTMLFLLVACKTEKKEASVKELTVDEFIHGYAVACDKYGKMDLSGEELEKLMHERSSDIGGHYSEGPKMDGVVDSIWAEMERGSQSDVYLGFVIFDNEKNARKGLETMVGKTGTIRSNDSNSDVFIYDTGNDYYKYLRVGKTIIGVTGDSEYIVEQVLKCFGY